MANEDHSWDFARVMRELGEAWSAVINGFNDSLNAIPIPPLLYHYTDDTGLRGILESGTLWCSDVFSLNDPSEFRYGVDRGLTELKAVARQLQQGSRIPLGEDFARHINANLQSIADYFACSFSRTKDDIGQWRAYADDGCGFALAFDGPVLDRAFTTASDRASSNQTIPVQYDEKRLIALQTELVSLARPALESIPHQDGVEEFKPEHDVLLIELLGQIATVALMFKHPAYDSEEEYRLLQILSVDAEVGNIKRRHKPYSLIRYREFPWRERAPTALREIIIGPAADLRAAGRFVSDCLRAFDVPNVSIYQSDIPYRSSSR